MNQQTKITNLLLSTERIGMAGMTEWLAKEGFFEAPASMKFHGCYPGGLAEHSRNVFILLDKYTSHMRIGEVTGVGQKPLPMDSDTIIIAALLHDVCKVGAYIGTEKPYKWNRQQPKGHALLSIARIETFIELTPLEKLMITYHMGVYGLNEFYSESDWQSGEFPLRGDHTNDEKMTREESKAARYGASMANAWFHNPICKLMYFCDEIETLQAKKVELDNAEEKGN